MLPRGDWRPLTLAQGNYWVSEYGDVWCGGLLAQYPGMNNFKRVMHRVNGRNITLYVHRLMAMAFLAPGQPRQRVTFLDGDKWNCHAGNLAWHQPLSLQERRDRWNTTRRRYEKLKRPSYSTQRVIVGQQSQNKSKLNDFSLT